MREIMEQYGKTLVASVVMVLILTLFLSVYLTGSGGKATGLAEIGGMAVEEGFSGTDLTVNLAGMEPKLAGRAEETVTASLLTEREYDIRELFSCEDGGRANLLSVWKDNRDAFSEGDVQREGDRIWFHTHGTYALRYTVVSKNGAERTGYLYAEVRR